MWLVSYISKRKAPISLVHFLKLEKMTQGISQDINPRQIEQIDILQIRTKNIVVHTILRMRIQVTAHCGPGTVRRYFH